ncbi:valine--tRNA ligase [Candidatus Hydrogenedentota bacterium]
METSLPKTYDPKKVERRIYQSWIEQGLFHSEPNSEKKPFTIVIPPPNVTAVLHMGHAFNNTLQDILIRYKRMAGHEAMWMPGTDHAGIATQNAVEKMLAKENLTRHDLGREKFVERVWKWKHEHATAIREQLEVLGCSCDWQRERFTMDEGLSRAVREVFVSLYEKGLIYRGKYIINWCPRCHTALADEEAPHVDKTGKLWYIKYPVTGADGHITVATTRPETMLGDVAVAVNPSDERYKSFLGKTLMLPLMDREIPIVEDDLVDPEFGTGAVKVTPAHDPNDFEMGRKHNLGPILVMDIDATMNENAGDYQGQDRYECRKKVIADLEELGLLEKIEDHEHSVGECYRCDTTVEPYLSEQWFVKIKPIADPAAEVGRNGDVKFVPERWKKVYLHWMDNIRDWCISRQLWWGHRIPVFYCSDCDEMMVCREDPNKCAACGSANIKQDEDVLDTWFSSWLWPISTLGWPDETEELKYYYPTDVLVTDPGILFFWVARMIMSGIEFRGEIPFHTVYLHGVVQDLQGRKMSKSLGNGIDPREMVEKYSADAVRFTVITLSSEGQNVQMADENIETGRNFANKVWNAFRLLMMNAEDDQLPEYGDREPETLEDKWILSRLDATVRQVTSDLDKLRINAALTAIYDFFWGEFCDWYLELIKGRTMAGGDTAVDALATGRKVFEAVLRLLHPFMPFITEEIWQLMVEGGRDSIMIADWPETDDSLQDERSERAMSVLQTAVGAVRNIRGEMSVPAKAKSRVLLRPLRDDVPEILEASRERFIVLAFSSELTIDANATPPEPSAKAFFPEMEIYVPLDGLIDMDKERARLEKEVANFERLLKGVQGKLSNKNFVDKAPAAVVEKEKAKRDEYAEKVEKLKESLAKL